MTIIMNHSSNTLFDVVLADPDYSNYYFDTP